MPARMRRIIGIWADTVYRAPTEAARASISEDVDHDKANGRMYGNERKMYGQSKQLGISAKEFLVVLQRGDDV